MSQPRNPRRLLRFARVLFLFPLFPLPLLLAQNAPVLTIDDECMALAYAPDGRIIYATRHVMTTRRLEIERDDFWLLGTDGKRRRIINGEKLVRGGTAFSYAVHSLRWSPDGTRLTAELLTSQMLNDRGDTKEGTLTLLLDETGKELKIAGADSVIPEATNGTWLADGVTVVYLLEAVKPKLLYSIASVRPVAGRGGALLPDHVYAAVTWNAKQSTAIAIERDRSLAGPPRLVALDLLKESSREIATLDAFVGGLSISPSGTKVAYFRDSGVLEIRDLAQPDRVARVRALYGPYRWAADERRILLKRAPERKSGDLVWIALPELPAPAQKTPTALAAVDAVPEPVLHGLSFRDFEISPDGKFLAVVQPGKRNLLVYPLQ